MLSKEVDRWMNTVKEIQTLKTDTSFNYSEPMPAIDDVLKVKVFGNRNYPIKIDDEIS